MKKILPLILIVVLAGAAWFIATQSAQTPSESNSVASNDGSPSNDGAPDGESVTGNGQQGINNGVNLALNSSNVEVEEDAGGEEILPAARVYSSADDAIAAVKKGAVDYDDSVLEQFTTPGDDCTWCPEFYKEVRSAMTAKDAPADQMSYFGEILAISGKVENIQALVDGIKNPPSQDAAQAFAEALELTIGNDAIVQFLGDQMSNAGSELLREASVAAVTNQGTRLAAETLEKHIVEKGDADAYYSQGIGPGEFVPEEESLSYVQNLVNKRDQFSPQWAKALLNSGTPGLKMLFDSLNTSKDPEGDRQILSESARDHVNFDEGNEAILSDAAENSPNPAVREWAKKTLDTLKAETEMMPEEPVQSEAQPEE